MGNKVKDIVEFLNMKYPENYQEKWDNSGSQILFEEKNVNKIVIAMDISDKLVKFAVENKADLIITHHPFFFKGIDKILKNDYKGKLTIKLIQNEISVYSSHTNLDIACEGVNDELVKILKLENISGLSEVENGLYLGRMGKNIFFKDVFEIKKYFEDNYNFKNIKIYGKLREIKKIALCGGAGADLVEDAIEKGADILITGDVKYHTGQLAYESNIMIMDIGHYNSEKFVMEKLKDLIKKKYNIESLVFDKNVFEITC